MPYVCKRGENLLALENLPSPRHLCVPVSTENVPATVGETEDKVADVVLAALIHQLSVRHATVSARRVVGRHGHVLSNSVSDGLIHLIRR